MTAILLKLPDDLLARSNRSAEAMRVTRAEYIRQALDRMNRLVEAGRRAKRLAEVSRRVRGESRRINAEFDAIEDAPNS